MSTAIALPDDPATTLPALIDRASGRLAEARSAAEVLEARELAGLAYDVARRQLRIAKAKGAHDSIVSATMHLQADALAIESSAHRRLADEYDGAQENEEVARPGRPKKVTDEDFKPTLRNIGLSKQQIHKARRVRDAELADPGIVERTVKTMAGEGKAPTRAAVKRAVAVALAPEAPAAPAAPAAPVEPAEPVASEPAARPADIADTERKKVIARANYSKLGIMLAPIDIFAECLEKLNLEAALSMLDPDHAAGWLEGIKSARRALLQLADRLEKEIRHD